MIGLSVIYIPSCGTPGISIVRFAVAFFVVSCFYRIYALLNNGRHPAVAVNNDRIKTVTLSDYLTNDYHVSNLPALI